MFASRCRPRRPPESSSRRGPSPVDGHYDCARGRYVRADPRWAVPPKGKRLYVAGSWRSGVRVAGRWR